jgi:hypothetical protein
MDDRRCIILGSMGQLGRQLTSSTSFIRALDSISMRLSSIETMLAPARAIGVDRIFAFCHGANGPSTRTLVPCSMEEGGLLGGGR